LPGPVEGVGFRTGAWPIMVRPTESTGLDAATGSGLLAAGGWNSFGWTSGSLGMFAGMPKIVFLSSLILLGTLCSELGGGCAGSGSGASAGFMAGMDMMVLAASTGWAAAARGLPQEQQNEPSSGFSVPQWMHLGMVPSSS
jgi:hypothetical protein